jgi:hypothetical protein
MNATPSYGMAEELRFFLRIALFTIVISTIYWFVAREEAGTALLVGVIVGCVVFVGIVGAGVRSSRRGGASPNALIGFADTEPESPLLLEEDTFPAASAWPVIASLAAALVGLGLIYGAWLWIPGAALGLSCAWGWLLE